MDYWHVGLAYLLMGVLTTAGLYMGAAIPHHFVDATKRPYKYKSSGLMALVNWPIPVVLSLVVVAYSFARQLRNRKSR